MQKILAVCFLLLSYGAASAQKTSGSLHFEQGKKITIQVTLNNTITQQAMGQAIDFNITGSATHQYVVTNTTPDNTTLHHTVEQIGFQFDGMGQKRSFDSGNAKDMDGPFGKGVKEWLGKNYDMIIDSTGKVLLVKPEKVELQKPDDRLALIMNMLRELNNVVYPPVKGGPSFFKILPAREVAPGDTWEEPFTSETGKGTTAYTLSAITDSTVLVNFKTTAASVIKSETMGGSVTTTLNSVATGTIVIDKATGIVRERSSNVDSDGTAEAMGSSMPIHSKMTITMKVN